MNLDDFIVASLAPDADDAAVDATRAADGEAAALAPTLEAQRALLADAGTWAEPPPLEEAVLGAILAERDAEQLPLAGPMGVVGDDGVVIAPRRRPSAWWSAVVAGAAALVVAVLVVGGDSSSSNDAVEVQLAGTELAPDARARAEVAEWSSGLRVDLDVDGLPPADPGHYYQAWVLGPAGNEALGSFHLHGDDLVVLWSGVPAKPGVIISVTREPLDGDAAPSDERVLVGTIYAAPGGD